MFKEQFDFKKQNMNWVEILENEYQITFSRSSGPGGQNVNKVETKATLRWDINKSKILNPEQKQKIFQVLKNKINEKGEMVIYEQSERSQLQNRQTVVEKLNRLINEALIPEKERRPTAPTKSAKEKRLQNKKARSETKQLRQKIRDY